MVEKVTVVNMVPNALSAEYDDDGEPTIAVDPTNPLRMAAYAYTIDRGNSGEAPFYYSTDGGNTWALNVALPGGGVTVQASLKFGGMSGLLYVAAVRLDNENLNVLRFADFTKHDSALLLEREKLQQPIVEAIASQDTDVLYIGGSDATQSPSPGNTATVVFALDAGKDAPPFYTDRPEQRGTLGYDQGVRTAVHPSGVVYASFIGPRETTESWGVPRVKADVVVCRDDDWGIGVPWAAVNPFTALKDCDGNPGLKVASVSLPPVGQLIALGKHQRINNQLTSIAVDPTDNKGHTAYLAWVEGVSGLDVVMHLRRSNDGGASWLDLHSFPNVINPCLAVNSAGTLGLLYQQLVVEDGNNRWVTHLELSDDYGETWISDLILADVLDGFGSILLPYYGMTIGDHADLMSVGTTFYGVFSGYNDPVKGNFPRGVTYQRNVLWEGKPQSNAHWEGKLQVPVELVGLNEDPVSPSVDPFFFKVEREFDYSPGGGGGAHKVPVRYGGKPYDTGVEKTVKAGKGDDDK